MRILLCNTENRSGKINSNYQVHSECKIISCFQSSLWYNYFTKHSFRAILLIATILFGIYYIPLIVYFYIPCKISFEIYKKSKKSNSDDNNEAGKTHKNIWRQLFPKFCRICGFLILIPVYAYTVCQFILSLLLFIICSNPLKVMIKILI